MKVGRSVENNTMMDEDVGDAQILEAVLFAMRTC